MPKVASTNVVDRAALLDFVRSRHRGIFITARRDGSPQASPVTCGLDTEGRVVVSTYPQRAKTTNARHRPACSIVVLSDDFDGPWVQIDGEAEVLDAPDSVEPLVDYFRGISGDHPDWAEYREAMVRQNKSVIRLTPIRWGPISTGGFPPELS